MIKLVLLTLVALAVAWGAHLGLRRLYWSTLATYSSIPSRMQTLFPHYALGGALGMFMLWFFVVVFWASMDDVGRLEWLFVGPSAVALGESLGFLAWRRRALRELHPSDRQNPRRRARRRVRKTRG